MNKGFARDEEHAPQRICAPKYRTGRAPNEKFSGDARKNSLTLANNFITQHPNEPSDGIYQPL